MNEISHDFREVTNHSEQRISSYDIQANDPQKRLRVLGGWLLNDIIEDLNLSNFEFHIMTFCKQCDLLEVKYPIHSQHIGEIRMDFWARAQEKHKLLKEMQVLEVKLRKRFHIMQDLKRMGF